MIKSIRHKGLKSLWEKGKTRYLNPDWLPRIGRILDALDVAARPEDMNIPGFYFHILTGDNAGRYSVRGSANWRITFTFDGEDAVLLDLEDYH
ncbi:MAG: type II toxin-antitoxin system RelE/ParE family toxin [Robiginitomaculum sp.]|nr:type II toxin-antitoxin system RelE/ParE family toxin [Robiginitomaculum sp.]